MSPQRSTNIMHMRIWRMAWPPMLSNITTPLLGLVDTAVVGHLSTDNHLGAVAIGASIFSLLFWAFGFLRMGATGMTAQAMGQQNYDRVRQLLFQSIVLGLGIGLLILICREPIIELALYLMAPSEEVAPWARTYANIRILSAPAVLCGYALVGWFYGIQYAKGLLWVMLLINLANMVLDLLVVFGFGYASDGVAWATVWAHYLGVLYAIYLTSRQLRRFPSHSGSMALLKWRSYLSLIRVNRYLFVRTVLLLLVMSFFTAQSARQGDVILAANSVLLTFLMIISNSLDGFAFAVEALCGRYLGAGKRTTFLLVVRLAGLWAAAASVLLVLIFSLFGEYIIALLTDLPDIRQAASEYLPWLISFPIIGVWAFMLDGVFIGTTSVKQMQNTMIISVLCVFLPCWYITQGWGNHGLWFSQAVFFAARGLSLFWCYRRNIRNHHWFSI